MGSGEVALLVSMHTQLEAGVRDERDDATDVGDKARVDNHKSLSANAAKKICQVEIVLEAWRA